MFQGCLQILLSLFIFLVLTPLLGRYIAQVFMGEKTILDSIINPLETVIYSWSGIETQESMTGRQYAKAVIYSNLIMGLLGYFILSWQHNLPFNPSNLDTPRWDLALHTTISFLTNTDQQHYTSENSLSYASKILVLGFFMFTSPATGISVSIAFIRGLTGRPLGNFYSDFIRSITRILLPISLIGSLLLLWSGVPETLAAPTVVTTLEGSTQVIAQGPVAHYEIIKELGGNGGGFFTVNSAHPYENPNGFSNFLELWAMISIPAALIHTYGIFINNPKQIWLLFSMVLTIFIILVSITAVGEYAGNPLVNNVLGEAQANLEGKEVRFGWAQTALWAVMTTATMCGAVNGMQDSLMPTGGFTSLLNMFLQVIWGGEGTGVAYLFIYLILAVFISGLMVGRTPEFLGRKIETKEIIFSSIILLIHPLTILIPWAIVFGLPDSFSGISNPGFHGVSQVVYEYTSAAANNGSGLEGLKDNSLWWNLSTTISILLGRYIPMVAMLVLADSMCSKQTTPITRGTLRTDTVLFTVVTGGVILIFAALTFFPVLVLGSIGEALQLAARG